MSDAVKVIPLGEEGSDDEQMERRNAGPPVNPEDVALEAAAIRDMQLATLENVKPDHIALFQSNKKDFNVVNSPGAILSEKVIINQQVAPTGNAQLEKMKGRTMRTLDQFKLDSYYETRATKSAKECLMSGKVLLQGPEKSGKTCIGLYILKTFDRSYKPLYIQNPADLEYIPNLSELKDVKKDSQYDNYIIFIDDPFKRGVEIDTQLTDLMELVECGRAHVIISISTRNQAKLQDSTLHICQGNKSQFGRNLLDFPLQEYERYEILKHTLRPPKVKSLGPTEGAQEAVLQEIAKSADYPWFFMAIESSRSKQGRELVASLKNPVDTLLQQLKHMAENEKAKFAALVIIMKDGFFEDSTCRPAGSPKSPQAMFAALNEILDTQDLSAKKISDAAKNMIGEYLICTNKTYKVIHGSVTDAVCKVLFSKSAQNMLEWCPLNYLILNTVTQDCEEEDADKLVIDDYEEILITRLLGEDCLMNAMEFPGFKSQGFVDKIKSRLKDKLEVSDYKDVLLQAITLGHNPWMEEIVQNVLRTLPESGEYVKHLALQKACEVGNREAYDELVTVGAEVNLPCMTACKMGKCPQIIHNVLKELANQFHQLSPDKLKEWILIVIPHGDTDAIKTFITNLPGRTDRSDLMVSALDVACKLGSLEKYTTISCDGLRPNWTSLLISASEGGNEHIISQLFHQRDHATADGKPCNTHLKEMFLAACRFNRKGAAELLHKRNASVLDGVTESGQTALHLAASVSHTDKPDTLTWLLKTKKWDTNSTDNDGFTALHSACFTGNVTCVKELLDAEFDTQALDKHGDTTLHVHLKGKFINKPVVEKLVKSKSASSGHSHIASVQNNDQQSPVHLLCMEAHGIIASILLFLMQDEDEFMKVEKKNGHSIARKDSKGQTPLHTLIASTGTVDILRPLLENKNVNIQTVDAEGNTVLHLACTTGNDEVIKMLMSSASNRLTYKETNNQGQTPLHCYADAENGKEKKTAQLLCKDVDAEDLQGQTALHLAVRKPYKSDVVKQLMNLGANVDSTDKKGRTPLHIVSSMSHDTSLEVAQMLVLGSNKKKQRADVNIADNEKMTAFHHACVSKGICSSQVAEFLLSRKVDIWGENVNTHLPIHISCIECSIYSPLVLRVLLKHLQAHNDPSKIQQMLSVVDKYGDTPLHKVCMSSGEGRRDVAEVLIDAGADLTLANNAGDTVMDITRRNRVNDLNDLMIMTAFIRACKEDINSDLEKLLSCDQMNSDSLSMMFQKLVQLDERHTVSVLERLILKGADIQRTTEDGLNVIHLAAKTQGEFTDRIIGFLMVKGADMLAVDKGGETALHKVAVGTTSHCAHLIRFLHSRGMAIDGRDHMGNTALHKLFSAERPLGDHFRTCMEALVRLKCPVDCQNKQGITPCALAKKHGEAVVKELLHTYCTKLDVLDSNALKDIIANGADINSRDHNGNTVLHKICTRRVSFVCNNVKVLLKLGADRFLKNNEEKLAFDLACETGLDEDVREATVTEMPSPQDLETDGASAASTPTTPLPRPPWVRSPSTEDWVFALRNGMTGIRNAAGMDHMDDEMENFERNARRKLGDHFNRYM
ncbi:serine/threonine-protein phosphatase 6 regulatory ankyrin repeat subunit A-like [Haliotis cracherodii]|uniref:serine/threonine-protein phosphatase 6 regulatory ankyrin repeat subunit A-like n=1 Tax=Haliotis cracherodii TaxID=6455 RepID=UPI0039ED1A86